jgi:hypothetical protein
VTQLCTSPRCRVIGQHHTDCAGDCRGCLPNLAGTGLALCYNHADRIGTDAVGAAHVWDELALALAPSGSGDGGGRGGNPHPSLVLHDGVVEVRAAIRHTLASWVRLIAEERAVHVPWKWLLVLPADGCEGPANRVRIAVETVAGLGEYVQVHARWLAAQDYADEVSEELATLVADARRVMQPSGTRVIPVGPCPMQDCGGELRALMRTERSLMPSSVTCDAEVGHEWTSGDWLALARSMKVSAQCAA